MNILDELDFTWKPNSVRVSDAYKQALEELKSPYPSIHLRAWNAFDRFTGGFRPREFSILCGPTGCGKTQFLACLSAQLMIQNVKHFVMSVETGHTDFVKRVMSSLSGEDLNTGDPVPISKLADISVRFAPMIVRDNLELSLYENRVPVSELVKELVHHAERGCKVAMIDNLNFFMEVKSAADQIIEMDRVIHELIILCKRIDMHVIMVMHPKKTDGGRVESEFDIKGSSTAVQEAHNVFLLNRPKAEDVSGGLREWNQRELKIAKMRRRGAFVGKSVWFESHGTNYVEKGFV